MGSAASGLSLLFFLFDILLSSLFTWIYVLFIEIIHHLVVIIFWSFIYFAWEDFCELGYLLFSQLSSLWHLYFKFDDKISMTHIVLVERHSQTSDYFFWFISNNLSFSSINIVNGIVKMLKLEFKANKSLY